MAFPAPFGLALNESDLHAFLTMFGIARSMRPPWPAPRCARTCFYDEVPGEESRTAIMVMLGDIEDCTPIEVACVLVHEAVHIWQWWMRYIGERDPSEEFEAYSIQGIAERLMEAYVELTTNPSTEARR